MQEPFRWLVGLSVIQAFESDGLRLRDFYFTGDDYRYKFDPETKERFIELLRDQFNSGVNCKERHLKWDTVIEQKTNELGSNGIHLWISGLLWPFHDTKPASAG